MNQERLIEELNGKVIYKDSEIRRLETSLHEQLKALEMYKIKYSNLKQSRLEK